VPAGDEAVDEATASEVLAPIDDLKFQANKTAAISTITAAMLQIQRREAAGRFLAFVARIACFLPAVAKVTLGRTGSSLHNRFADYTAQPSTVRHTVTAHTSGLTLKPEGWDDCLAPILHSVADRSAPGGHTSKCGCAEDRRQRRGSDKGGHALYENSSANAADFILFKRISISSRIIFSWAAKSSTRMGALNIRSEETRVRKP
jgi:hypothetical protein